MLERYKQYRANGHNMLEAFVMAPSLLQLALLSGLFGLLLGLALAL